MLIFHFTLFDIMFLHWNVDNIDLFLVAHPVAHQNSNFEQNKHQDMNDRAENECNEDAGW